MPCEYTDFIPLTAALRPPQEPVRGDDPFAEAKAIRRGEGELPDYEVLTGWLGRVPMTWLPALTIRIIELATIRGVFKDKAALLRVVERAADKAGDPLRTAPPQS